MLIIQYDHSLALVPANVSNTLAYHQLQRATQSQFIISLIPEVSQLLDSNIPQLSILYKVALHFKIGTIKLWSVR